MTNLRAAGVAMLAGLASTVLWSGTVLGHAELVSANPAANASLRGRSRLRSRSMTDGTSCTACARRGTAPGDDGPMIGLRIIAQQITLGSGTSPAVLLIR